MSDPCPVTGAASSVACVATKSAKAFASADLSENPLSTFATSATVPAVVNLSPIVASALSAARKASNPFAFAKLIFVRLSPSTVPLKIL